jgi:hypothetical protein
MFCPPPSCAVDKTKQKKGAMASTSATITPETLKDLLQLILTLSDDQGRRGIEFLRELKAQPPPPTCKFCLGPFRKSRWCHRSSGRCELDDSTFGDSDV